MPESSGAKDLASSWKNLAALQSRRLPGSSVWSWPARRASLTLGPGGSTKKANVDIDDAQRSTVKLLISRERELLTLCRKQERLEAWLDVARDLGGLDFATTGPNEALRRISESLKRKLAFQRVSFFEQAGASLRPFDFEADSANDLTIAGPVAKILSSARDGQSSDSTDHVALKRAVGLEQFLWHWAHTTRSSILLVAGYDHERAPFYPRFDQTECTQFAILGAQIDRLLCGVMGHEATDSEEGAARRESFVNEMSVLDASRMEGVGGTGPRGREPPPYGLSGRELDVSQWLARGKSNKEIASILGISPRTVQIHVAHIFDKVGVRSRAGAASRLVQHHVVG